MAKGNAIFGIPIAAIITFFVWMFIIDPALEPELEKLFNNLGDKTVCPPELGSSNYQICIERDGNIVVDGKIIEPTTLKFESNLYTDECSIHVGDYKFEYVKCQFDKIKSVSAFNLIMINSKGRVSLSSSSLVGYLSSSKYIRKIAPKSAFRLLKFWKYIPK